MNIIIIGCGKTGAELAEELNAEGHDITIVDRDEKRVRDLAMSLDVFGVSGNGAILDVQREAGVEKSDLLIACTGSDELNMLICLIARKAGDCMTICRIRNFEYENEIDYLQKELGLSMVVNPEKLTAHEVIRLLHFPSATEIESFSYGKAEMVTVRLKKESPLSGLALKDLHRKFSGSVLIAMIQRGQEVLIPSGDTELQGGDLVSFIADADEAMSFLKKCDPTLKPHRSVFVVGAGRITNYILEERMRMKNPMDFKCVDMSEARCVALSERYQDVTFINGNGTDQALLREENLEGADVLVTLTGIDEQNVMMSLIAHENYGTRLITKVNHMEPEDIPDSLDIGSLVVPKTITANEVVRFVRAMDASKDSSITSLYKLANGRAEAQEYEVLEESGITDVTLKDLRTKPNLLIAAIFRDGELLRPSGSDMIRKGDHIVIVTRTDNEIRSLSDIAAEA